MRVDSLNLWNLCRMRSLKRIFLFFKLFLKPIPTVKDLWKGNTVRKMYLEWHISIMHFQPIFLYRMGTEFSYSFVTLMRGRQTGRELICCTVSLTRPKIFFLPWVKPITHCIISALTPTALRICVFRRICMKSSPGQRVLPVS